MKIVLLGPPGAGKSTVRDRIVEKYDLFHLSTGDAFRAEISGKTEVGLMAKEFIDAGKLVPDDVVLAIVGAQLDGHENYVLDGFPRTVAQAEAFAASGEDVDLVLMFDISFEEAYERLHSRAQEARDAGEAVRSDDSKEIMKARFEEYEKKTGPLKEHFAALEKVAVINAELDRPGVWAEVENALNSKGF